MPSLTQKYSYYLSSIFRLLTGIHEWPLLLRVYLGAAPAGEKSIRLRQSGIRFKVRGPMDIWSIKETFLDRFYERFGTVVGDGWIVLDIGAGIGEFTLEAACGHPRNTVYAFEPFAESFALLEENLRLNQVGNVLAFPLAIGAKSGSIALDLSGGEPLQLQSYPSGDHQNDPNTRVVPSLSLAEVFARNGLLRCDLLKADCEGAEYSILLNAPDEVLGRIQRIILETHDGIGGHTPLELVAFLTQKGFQVRTVPNYVHDHLGYLYAWRE